MWLQSPRFDCTVMPVAFFFRLFKNGDWIRVKVLFDLIRSPIRLLYFIWLPPLCLCWFYSTQNDDHHISINGSIGSSYARGHTRVCEFVWKPHCDAYVNHMNLMLLHKKVIEFFSRPKIICIRQFIEETEKSSGNWLRLCHFAELKQPNFALAYLQMKRKN